MIGTRPGHGYAPRPLSGLRGSGTDSSARDPGRKFSCQTRSNSRFASATLDLHRRRFGQFSSCCQSTMETIRPIPVTILDILAVLLPGCTWLLLVVTTFGMFRGDEAAATASPVQAWYELAEFIRNENSWFAPISLIVVALVIGYAMKPIAMTVTEWITTVLLKAGHMNAKMSELKFPFDGLFKNKKPYSEVRLLIEESTCCPADEIYGKQPFSGAKRYLRLVAPALWEESERMEAEVRMVGSMFLTALYSIVLSTIAFVRYHFRDAETAGSSPAGEWLLLSLVAATLLALSFNTSRVREVGFTYMNALIARGCRGAKVASDEHNGDT